MQHGQRDAGVAAEQLRLKLLADENALANLGLTLQQAQFTVQADHAALALQSGQEAIATQEDILERLQAEQRIADETGALTFGWLTREVEMRRAILEIRQQELALAERTAAAAGGTSAPTASAPSQRLPTTAANAGSLPSFQHGTPYVPRTGLALVHQGERIVPASLNSHLPLSPQATIPSGEVSGAPPRNRPTQITYNITLTIPVTLPPGMSRITAQSLVAEITPAINEAIRNRQIAIPA